MWHRLLARMVDRAIPPFLADPSQENVAAEAAENAIRQTLRGALVIGVVLLAGTAAVLSRHLPGLPISSVPWEAAKTTSQAASQLEANTLRLRQENGDLQKENTSLRQTNEDSQKKLDAATKAREAAEGKVTDLEGQVKELAKKLQAAEASAAGQKGALRSPRRATVSGRSRVGASPRPYECGNGRTASDPAMCRGEGAAVPPPDTYACGNGRTVRDPADCKPS